MTRVLHINHTAVVGGAERSLLALLDHTDTDRIAGVCCPPGPLADQVVARDLAWYPTPEAEARFDATTRDRLVAGWRLAAGGGMVEMVARSTGADVVHANSIRAGLGVALTTRRVVTHVRDILPPGRTARTVKHVIAARSSRVVGISGFVAQRFRGDVVRAGRWAVVDNPIDLRSFPVRDPGERSEARRRLGFEPGAPLALVVGQITPWKRQLLAIEAMASLRARGSDAQLAVVGSVKFTRGRTGERNRDYERLLRHRTQDLGLDQNITFCGERNDVGELFAAASVVLVPSLDEPFGRVAAEAVSSGIPVLTSASGGPADVLRRCGGGLPVGEDSAEAWSAALEALLPVGVVREPTIGREVIERVRSTFDARRHARAMGHLFDDVAAD